MHMKINHLILAVAAMLCFSSCGKVLDGISPKHAVTTDNVGESDLNKLTNGVLYTMESCAGNGWFDGDRMGELFHAGPGGAALVDVLLMTPSTPDVLSRWQKLMTSLRQVNELLAAAATAEGTQASENAMKTAYFFRAWIYYNMVTRWGTAPIIDRVTNEEIPLSSEADVWGFIIGDLQEALRHTGTGTGFFYVSDDAINALLAKSYLWSGDDGAAVTYADKVISSPSFSLASTSGELAATWCYGTVSKEIVFALANKRTSDQITLYTSLNDTDGSWNYSIPYPTDEAPDTPDLFSTMYADDGAVKSGDIRRSVVLTDDERSRILKYPNGNAEQYQFVENEDPNQSPLVLIRIAEMYLVKAEAYGNTPDGHAVLEDFMQKRYASVSIPASMTDSEWEDLLLDEYRREFFAEGHWWFDVKRTGRLDKFSTLDGRDYLMDWPIPQHEIDLLTDKSAYPQNEGYATTQQ